MHREGYRETDSWTDANKFPGTLNLLHKINEARWVMGLSEFAIKFGEFPFFLFLYWNKIIVLLLNLCIIKSFSLLISLLQIYATIQEGQRNGVVFKLMSKSYKLTQNYTSQSILMCFFF